ncbi:arsenite methyltransferase isoform X1 [Mobula hypostoma]|uniref:arsenite methyltransferase isoform X1 n=1 Tax=Mobula hypostoma TaxID=723540 RepID=UPI002FC2C8DE
MSVTWVSGRARWTLTGGVMAEEPGSGERLSSTSCGQHLKIHEEVKDYYGKRLKRTGDLVLNACVTPAKACVKHVHEALKDIHEEVSARYYGCGLVVPESLENCWILDLGSGSGRDCYMLSKLVGEKGHVTGIDMTDGQEFCRGWKFKQHTSKLLVNAAGQAASVGRGAVDVSGRDPSSGLTEGRVQLARKFIDYHTEKFGFSKPNVDFLQGYIENLGDVGLKDNTFDIIISNCVINLSPDKAAVLEEAYRVLKDGGEMYFSDIYADCELPESVRKHKVLWGECLGGALWWKEFLKIVEKVGFSVPRLVSAAKVPVVNEELQELISGYKFVSVTCRLFKIPAGTAREKSCVIYNGSITDCREKLEFDINYTFKEGQTVIVDEETAAILNSSRFANDFTIQSLAKVSPSSAECPPTESQGAAVVDPFQLSEKPAEGQNPSGATACCTPSKGC